MEFIILIIFVFCAAMAVGGILLTTRLLSEQPLPFLRPLFYHLIFMSAFGFYGIWGQFIIIAVAGERLTPELISTVSVISLLPGLPFLVIGWLMLIKFSAEYSKAGFKSYLTVIFLLANFGVIALLGIISRDMEFGEALPLFKYYYAVVAVISGVTSAFMLIGSRSGEAFAADRISLAVIVAAGALSQAAVLLLIQHSAWMALIFVFLLFAGISLIPVWLTYRTDLSVFAYPANHDMPPGIEDFYLKHEISPREADIIREICNGLSNQEIADRLFISLQTVKDHTSRIYAKTNVRNRMQLMTLVRSVELSQT
jgi:DNA-binding CsgD family transcriptional regulator